MRSVRDRTRPADRRGLRSPTVVRLAALVIAGFALLGFTRHGSAFAAEKAPTLDHIYPVAVQRGTTTVATAVGKFAPWPVKVWTDASGISFRADKAAGKFSVEVSPDAALGPHLIRIFNDGGASAPRFLIVTAHPQGTEVEPNDDFTKAPRIENLPTAINGRLNKSGDVDSYPVKLEAGQTLIASLEAYVLGSPVDAVLRLVDQRGVEQALNHDDGRTLDPFLAFRAITPGTYVLQVFGFAHPSTADVRFTGSDACVYRLHLSRGPQVHYTLPLGVSRTTTTKLRVFGWNVGPLSGREFELEGSSFPADASQVVWQRPEFENPLTLPLGDGPELIEPGLSLQPRELPALASPFAITGCIRIPDEQDRFSFNAMQGEKLLFEIQSASRGFPLDAWLAIQDAGGRELARNDDGTGPDPVLEWTAPATGTYSAIVGGVLHRGGADHLYRLNVQPARPRFTAVVAESGFAIEPGKKIKIKVSARRVHGFKSSLTASIIGLPDGLTTSPVAMGETAKEISLELTASSEAPPFSGPIRIHLREDDSEVVHVAVQELIATSLKNGVPQGFRDLVIRSTDQLWLTVLTAPEAKIADEKVAR